MKTVPELFGKRTLHQDRYALMMRIGGGKEWEETIMPQGWEPNRHV